MAGSKFSEVVAFQKPVAYSEDSKANIVNHGRGVTPKRHLWRFQVRLQVLNFIASAEFLIHRGALYQIPVDKKYPLFIIKIIMSLYKELSYAYRCLQNSIILLRSPCIEDDVGPHPIQLPTLV